MTEKHPLKKAVVNAETVAHLADEPFASAKVNPSIEASVQDTHTTDELNAEFDSFVEKK
ncbi:MAG: hypothetical protein LBT37_02395 [Lactobacillaceae bacterium]|jgi:hypothetical protein|nr:hypothetical protein [Lactobacillaceae bacterium]